MKTARSPKVQGLGTRSGLHGMSEFYGAHDDAESLATLNRALELGSRSGHADAYGLYQRGTRRPCLQGGRERVFLAPSSLPA